MTDFAALTAQIEAAIDAHPELTRERRGGRGVEVPTIAYSKGSWTAPCSTRSKVARGRGSQLMSDVTGHSDTPDAAVEDLIESIPTWGAHVVARLKEEFS